MAAAGAGTGSSPDVARGGQQVTQGHGRDQHGPGDDPCRGRTTEPRHRGSGVLHTPAPAGERQRRLSGCRGPCSAGPSSARRARGKPGAPAGLGPGGAAGEPRRLRPLGSAAGLGRGGSSAPGELKIPERRDVSAHRAAPSDLERGRLRGRRWRPAAPACRCHRRCRRRTHPRKRGWHTCGSAPGHTCCARDTERGRCGSHLSPRGSRCRRAG